MVFTDAWEGKKKYMMKYLKAVSKGSLSKFAAQYMTVE
jgi:hypothetical protein